ncbi:DUF3592 domain-containing protein [Glycomyces sp. NPDC048151]|uniref:DUF3592 domain-containing protein n=1 Tax=Glycomyces sp. NPDC048151 TaxID=3364002 RepID=UPI003715A0CF
MAISAPVGIPVGLLFIVFPAVAACVFTARFVKRRRTWTHVTGTVTSVKTVRTSNDTTTTVRYRFTDATGEQRSGTETTLRTPREGKKVGVMYNPADPNDNELSSVAFLVLVLPFMMGMIGFGVFMFLSGLADLSGQTL